MSRSYGTACALLSLLFVGLACSSCSHWRRQWIDPALVVERDHPTRLRVTRVDGARVEIRNPTIAGDSLSGHPAKSDASVKSLSVPLHEVEFVEARRSRSAPRILIFGLILPFALGVAVALSYD